MEASRRKVEQHVLPLRQAPCQQGGREDDRLYEAWDQWPVRRSRPVRVGLDFRFARGPFNPRPTYVGLQRPVRLRCNQSEPVQVLHQRPVAAVSDGDTFTEPSEPHGSALRHLTILDAPLG